MLLDTCGTGLLDRSPGKQAGPVIRTAEEAAPRWGSHARPPWRGEIRTAGVEAEAVCLWP